MKLKYNSDQWCKLTGITVYDPDGWDRQGDFQSDWDKLITLYEFLDKASSSTTSGLRDVDEIEKMVLKNLIRY